MKTWSPSDGKTLFACAYLPEFPAQALLRLRQSLRSKPVAVLADSPPYERVCAGNALARRIGLQNGMMRAETEALPGAMVLPRSKDEEEAARAALLSCVSSFSPVLETCHTDAAATCVLDTGSMTRLFSDPWAFGRALHGALLSRGFDASLGICANFDAARMLAQGTPGMSIVKPGEEQQALAPVLLSALERDVLELTEEQAHTLSLWGISTLGGVAALPQKELIARMGQSGKRLRELARGEHPHVFAPVPVPWQLHEKFVFDAPVHLLEAIFSVLSTMLDQLILQAHERALAIATATVTFVFAPEMPDAQTNSQTNTAAAAASSHVGETSSADHAGAVRFNAAHRSAIHLVPSKAEVLGLGKTSVSAAASPHAFSPGGTYQCTINPKLPTQDKRLLLRLLQLELATHPLRAPVSTVILEAAPAQSSTVKSGLFTPSLF